MKIQRKGEKETNNTCTKTAIDVQFVEKRNNNEFRKIFEFQINCVEQSNYSTLQLVDCRNHFRDFRGWHSGQ